MLSTLAITLIMAPELLTGFPTHMGGNDGLVHESFGFDISQALHDGRYADVLRGGEKIFYFMPGMRYLKALEDMLFGDTNFCVLLCTMFVPIFLYFILRRLFPLRWSGLPDPDLSVHTAVRAAGVCAVPLREGDDQGISRSRSAMGLFSVRSPSSPGPSRCPMRRLRVHQCPAS